MHRLSPFDFTRETFDAAIHFGTRDWQGVDYLELTRETVIPAVAPQLLAGRQVEARDLLALPLLHLESRPGAWEDWFARQGCKADRLRGMLFDQFSQMAEAACLGFGAALLPSFIAEAEFARGRLVPAAAGATGVDASYFCVWPQVRTASRPLQTFLAWLETEVSESRAAV